MMRLTIAVFAVATLSLPSIPATTLTAQPAATGAVREPPLLLDRARALHKQVPLIDGHIDYPWALREKTTGRDLAALDIRLPQPGIHTDIPRLRAGGVGGVFWSVYVPATLAGQSAVTATLEQIDIVHRMMQRYPDTFELARTAADVERIFKAGKIASMIGMEGGHSIDSSLAALRMFSRLGAKYMTITHSRDLPWAEAAADKPKGTGLTTFGEAVIREMNWLGMLVDLSHVSIKTMEDAIRVSEAPIIFSHSSARAVCDVPRNVPDHVLQMLPKNGGVIMVTFVPSFVTPLAREHRRAVVAEEARLKAQPGATDASVKESLAVWRKSNPEPRATLAQVADHIDHVRKVAGIDHIGIGSDFDGIESTPAGLEDVSTFPALTAELLGRGYSDNDVKKILGLNVLRVMRTVERVSAKLQAARPPSTETIQTTRY
jgi:membrane dipeptidase